MRLVRTESSVKSLNRVLRTSLIRSSLVLSMMLTACAQFSPKNPANAASDVPAPISANAPESPAAKTEASEDAEPVRKTTENLPSIDLNQKILYQLLMSEIAAQRGMQDAAFATELNLAKETRDPRLARRATEFALGFGQPAAALQAARLWVELNPESDEARNSLMAILVASNRLDEAEPVMLQRLMDSAAGSDARLTAFGQVYGVLSRSPNRSGAFNLMHRLVAQAGVEYARIAEIHLMLAQSAQNAGEKASAVEELQIALTLKPDWDLGTIMMAQYQLPDNPKQAETVLTDFLKRHPKSVEVRLAYARLLVNTLRSEEARVQFQRLLKEEPANADMLYTSGTLAYQAESKKEAEVFFLRFLERQKQNQQVFRAVSSDTVSDIVSEPVASRNVNGAYLFLAQIAEDRKDYDKTLEWLAQVQEGNEYLSARIQRARILARTGKLDAARAELQTLDVSSDRERAQLIMAESQLLREAKRYDESFDLLTRALQRMPDNPDLLYDHAMAAVPVKKLDVMESSLRSLIRLRPNFAHGYNALGYTLADQNLRLPEALTLIEKALSLAPDDPSVIDSMGWVQYRLGNYPQAIDYLERAYKIRQDADVAVHLGEALWATGRKSEAENFWMQASHKEPDSELLQQTLLRFKVNIGALAPLPATP